MLNHLKWNLYEVVSTGLRTGPTFVRRTLILLKFQVFWDEPKRTQLMFESKIFFLRINSQKMHFVYSTFTQKTWTQIRFLQFYSCKFLVNVGRSSPSQSGGSVKESKHFFVHASPYTPPSRFRFVRVMSSSNKWNQTVFLTYKNMVFVDSFGLGWLKMGSK